MTNIIKPIKFIGLYLDISEYIEIEEKNKLVNKLSNDVIYEWDIQKMNLYVVKDLKTLLIMKFQTIR